MHVDDVPAETSKRAEKTWTVPSTSGTSLHLFSEHINADGSVDPASLRIAWIPLRGTIRVDRFCATPSA